MEQTRSELKEKFQDGDIPTGTDFANLIDSFLNYEDDGLTSYKSELPGSEYKRFGIGDTTPECPLGIMGEADGDDGMICFTSHDGSTKWNINLNPSPSNVPGFSIDDSSSGTSLSRLFIQPETGFVGIGSLTPEALVHMEGNAPVDYVSALVRNVGTFNDHQGYLLSHYAGDSLTDIRDGAFAINENSPGGKVERITVLPQFVSDGQNTYNVGINEMMPFSTLHVSRSLLDPKRFINLSENTGIFLLGSIEDKNLGFDASDIQARKGEVLTGGDISITASTLGLQPRGGDITIHGSLGIEKQVKISDTGKIGVGKEAIESVDVNGAITISNSPNPTTAANGTIRWTGTDFEGRKAGTWVSLTKASFTDGIWEQPGGPETGLIYFPSPTSPELPKVGIGTETPTKTLEIFTDENVVDTSNTAMLITTQAATTGSTFSNTRVGLEVQNSLSWSSNLDARNVGIYVSTVEGQNHEANIAALLNGNVVVGALVGGENLIGVNGRNVLAIQTGDVPTTPAGSTDTAGIQIYSDNIATVTGSPDEISVAHIMNGDGSVMRFFQQGPITEIDINTPNTGNPVTDAIISNTRQRVLDLENVLKNLGLLIP